jgi:hypothetical protein
MFVKLIWGEICSSNQEENQFTKIISKQPLTIHLYLSVLIFMTKSIEIQHGYSVCLKLVHAKLSPIIEHLPILYTMIVLYI